MVKKKSQFTFFDWVTGNSFVRGGWRWFLRHALFFSIVGIVVLFILYFNILEARTLLPDGYHSDPKLTTMSEFLWFMIGGLMYLSFTGIKRLFRKKKKKRGRN